MPKITVITRKAFGGAYDVMSSKHIRGDVNLAWPAAEIAVMGAEGAAKIVFRREIMEAPTIRWRRRSADRRTTRSCSTRPYEAASRGYIDDVIEPAETRVAPHRALEITATKRDQQPGQEAREHPACDGLAAMTGSALQASCWWRTAAEIALRVMRTAA